MPSPRLTCFRPTWNGRAPSRDKTPPAGVLHDARARGSRRADPRDRRARRDRVCGRRPKQRRELGPRFAGHDDRPAAQARPAHRLPGGLHPRRDGRPHHRGEQDRRGQAPHHAQALRAGVPAGHEDDGSAGRLPEERAESRGLSLPRDLRLHRGHDVEGARRRPARGLRPQLEPDRPQVREVEEPDPVRRPHHRLDDREGGAGAEGAATRRRGDLQPAPPGYAARHRRHDPLRLEHPADAGDPAEPAGDPPRRTTLAVARESRRPRSANPGLASMQAAAHPAKVDYLYFVRKADCKSHFFTASLDEFNNYPRGGLDCG